jgi:uncharacterized RDD family membrane protein YckC
MIEQNFTAEPTHILLEEPPVYAGFWERFAAALLDGLILCIPNFLFNYMIGPGLGFFGGIILTWLYSAILESGEHQATFGKRALGLKVTDLNGQRVSFGQASGRFFGKYVSALILCIGYLMMLWDDRKQTLHDKMAGTLVVKA